MSVPHAPPASPPSQRWRPGLRAYLLALVLAVALPALLFGVVAVYKAAEGYGALPGVRLQGTAHAVALALDREIETHLVALTALASSPCLDRLDYEGFDAQARQVAAMLDSRVVLIDQGLRQVVNTALPLGASLPAVSPASPAARVLATGRAEVSDVFTRRNTGEPIVAVLAPVLRHGRAVKALAMALRPTSLARILHELELPAGSFAILTDSRQAVIAHSQAGPDAIGRPAPAWYADAMAGAAPKRFTVGHLPDGEPVAVAVQRLSRAPWSVAIAEPLAAYEATWRRPLAGLALAGLVLLALAATAALALARRVLRPMEALAHQARAVTSGGAMAAVPERAAIAEFDMLYRALAEAEAARRSRVEAERAAAEAAQGSEARLRALLEQMPLGVALVEAPSGRLVFCNAKALEILGEPLPFGSGALAPSEVLRADGTPYAPHERPIMRAILAGETVEQEELIYRRPDGRETQLEVSTAPIRDAAGAIVLGVSAFGSIDARKEAEEQRRLLTAELSHRVKNTLAIVQALMTQTLLRSRSLPEFRAVYEGRLHALARAHDLLLRNEWRCIDLGTLVEAELAVFARSAGRVEAKGPSLLLSPRQGLALGLILHELVSNAARHGALSDDAGRVEIAWAEKARQVRLRWRERGGPPVAPAPADGFGLELIRRSTGYDLGGRAECIFSPEGVQWIVIFPR